MRENIEKDIEIIRRALKNTPEARKEKVDAVKRAIENGTYHVTPEMVAEKIISGHR